MGFAPVPVAASANTERQQPGTTVERLWFLLVQP